MIWGGVNESFLTILISKLLVTIVSLPKFPIKIILFTPKIAYSHRNIRGCGNFHPSARDVVGSPAHAIRRWAYATLTWKTFEATPAVCILLSSGAVVGSFFCRTTLEKMGEELISSQFLEAFQNNCFCAWKSHTVFGDTPCSLCDLGFWKISPYLNSGVSNIVVGTYPIIFHKMVKLCAHKIFGSRKGPLAAQSFAFVGYEPKLALTTALMESRRHRDRDRARVRSADAQLDEMVSQQVSTGSRVMGAVGDLLHGLLPTPAGGQIFSSAGGASGPARGRQGPGVRSVRVGAVSGSGAEGSGVPRGDQGLAGDRRPAQTEGELFLQVSPPREAAEPDATGGALNSAAGAADDGAFAGGGGIAADGSQVATGAPTLGLRRMKVHWVTWQRTRCPRVWMSR